MKSAGAFSALGIVVLSVLLVSCTPTATPTPVPTPTNTVIGVLGGPGCEPPSPVVGGEIQGTVIGTAMAYGQLQVADPTELTVGESIKFVLRMTGAGSLSANLTSPDGTTRPLDWGPEPHAASNYDRPGDEWGMGFSFDAPGCWALNLNRDRGDRATFWMTAQGVP